MLLKLIPVFVAGNVAWNTRIRAFTHAQTKFPPVALRKKRTVTQPKGNPRERQIEGALCDA